MKTELTVTVVALTLLFAFIIFMAAITLAFIKALFKYPALRKQVWKGITDGDDTPHQDDFRKTALLFWACVFGTLIVIFFLLWAAFPQYDWKIPIIIMSAVFLGCLGLKSLSKFN